jgi:hypothetical protein
MKKFILLLISCCVLAASLFSQTNITLSNPQALPILLGNYNPADYAPSVVINDPDSILHGVINRVSEDTLISWLMRIDGYYNRNTGSDTVSQIHGIGAVRRWIYSKLEEFSIENENRLMLSYMDFDKLICGRIHHRNVLGILPGLDTTNKEIMVIEGHFDTRCQGVCDTACYSPGMEDNGSGTVLVMELARILSHYAFNRTILFACVTGEDQGLYGSSALAAYLYSKNVKVRACFNNDVIGGILCGQTSSPPGCSGLNSIDSTHVRIFSFSHSNDSSAVSPHKQLARYIRMHQENLINPLLSAPMDIVIHIYEDRIGRSGDQVPFRKKGYTAIRFCSQNEYGDGTGTPPDRQHTSDDILGLDLSVPPDGVIDSFFVDPGYLRRNVIMNGVNLGLLALAPPEPDPVFETVLNGVKITLQGNDLNFDHKVAFRIKDSGTLNFDSFEVFSGVNSVILGVDPSHDYYVSVANVSNNTESLFCDEYTLASVGINPQVFNDWGIRLLHNIPNPFHDETKIVIESTVTKGPGEAELLIRDIAGRTLKMIPVEIRPGTNTLVVENPGFMKGLYTYSLSINGKIICTQKMSVY